MSCAQTNGFCCHLFMFRVVIIAYQMTFRRSQQELDWTKSSRFNYYCEIACNYVMYV